LNVAIRTVTTPYVLLSDADFLYPSIAFDFASPSRETIIRTYVGRMTAHATRCVMDGRHWQDLFCDYAGVEGRLFSGIYGAHNPCIYPTAMLHQVRGYDERMVGWGAEDDDLTERTRRMGAQEQRLPIIVADLWHEGSPDYPNSYGRGKTSNVNLAILNDPRRPAAANPCGWGDGE
jgi:hypothetical protein